MDDGMETVGLLSEVSRFEDLAGAELDRALPELVRTLAAVALGYSTADAVDSTRMFKELGFSSLSAVELRLRLNDVLGLTLPASLIFACPTLPRLVAHLRAELAG